MISQSFSTGLGRGRDTLPLHPFPKNQTMTVYTENLTHLDTTTPLHSKPADQLNICHSERSEESLFVAQDRLREESRFEIEDFIPSLSERLRSLPPARLARIIHTNSHCEP